LSTVSGSQYGVGLITLLVLCFVNFESIANALLEYESISGDEMKQVINGEPIVRIEPKEQKKRVRRRKNTSKNVTETSGSPQPIITKPAT